jgi:hypothetical protein
MHCETSQPNQVVGIGRRARYAARCSKKEVDEKRETLHNLASLLLTNKTLCRQVASSAEQVL